MTNSLETPNQTPELIDPEPKPFPWAEVLSSIWLQRKWIAIFVVATTMVAIGITFLIQPLYTAQTSILPELTKERTLGLAALASLAEATGLNVGETPVSKLYPMIVKSERILRGVIYHEYATRAYTHPASLVKYWRIEKGNKNKEFDNAFKQLLGRTDLGFDTRLSDKFNWHIPTD